MLLTRLFPALLIPLLTSAADPVISEFMAKNDTSITDEDGDRSDWIEIHNPGTSPVSLNDWYLTDSQSDLTKWRFPDVTLAPGEFRIIWASGKNRAAAGGPLHTGFSLSKDGEYLALVGPDGATVSQEFAPAYPAMEDDESYGALFDSEVLIAPGATTRYQVPTSDAVPGSTWTAATFNDGSWASGPSGLGYGMAVPGITFRQVMKNGAIDGLVDALALLALPPGSPGILAEATEVVPTVNYLGEGADGHYGFNRVLPAGGTEQYATRATGFVEIPTAGVYTFGINSDDGCRIVIDGSVLVNDDSFHGPQDTLGSRFLSAGLHSFEAVQFEGYGGDCVEFFAAAGTHSEWNASFKLVGDTAAGGLAASSLPGGAGGLIATDLGTVMNGKPGAYFRTSFDAAGVSGMTALSLVTRHNDGFAAWVNGAAAASDLASPHPLWNSVAAASRSSTQSLTRKGFSIGAALAELQPTGNVLAIHGLKADNSDPSFLILPELIAGKIDLVSPPAFYSGDKATPGWINGEASSLGRVADTAFSVNRGIYSSAQSVAITSATPGAVIRYTTDGSEPGDANGLTYSAPLAISKTTVLRARATKPGWQATNVDTQTYLFPEDILNQSPSGAAPPGWPSNSGTSQVLDYGMDPDIVNHGNPDIGGRTAVKEALLSLPMVSLTTALPNLFNMNGSQGIYSNAYGRGFAWERPASIEWINPPDELNPNGSGEFQLDAGIRIRGGFSRSDGNPKHSFRVICRGEYGDSKLDYPLFGAAGAQEFDKIDFRTAQNYSWSFGGDDRNTFLRDEASRLAQIDMGQPGSHVRYFHLFLNGQYWGLFNLDERTEANFSASYMGGDSDEWDVVKGEGDAGFRVGANDGDLVAWRELWDLCKVHRASPTNANFFKLSGLAADGATRTDDPVMLDVDNLIDYMMVTFWTGNLDGATSAFIDNNTKANNWSASRRRDNNPGRGFTFYVHDFEHTFLNVNENRTGPFSTPNEFDFQYSNPMFLHQDLLGNLEYRMRWADRVHKHLFNDGVLTPAAWQNRINQLATIVDQSIIAESARWGDAMSSTPKTRQTWINAQNEVLNYLSPRAGIVLNQLRTDGLYPSINAPNLNPPGGYVASGSEVVIDGPPGADLHYMDDGSDPRLVGGGIRPGAKTYTSSSTLTTLIPLSSSGWRYLGDGSNQGIGWRDPDFDDSSWPQGTAELGYGDGDEATTVPIVDVDPGTAGIQKAATCYFRKTFNVADLAGVTNLAMEIEYDDAYAVYLNGVRVAGNLPVDPGHDYYTGSAIEDTFVSRNISPDSLRVGTNVLAVEIHQADPGSSDISMNASLRLQRSTSATPLILSGAGEKVMRFRAKAGADWSALTEAAFLLDTDAASPANLVISKIMYHPADPSPAEIAAGFDNEDDFEFIELLNTGSSHVDLGGVYLFGAVTFHFDSAPTGRTLAPGGRLLVVSNLEAFTERYGSALPVAGEYSGNLRNSGERVMLFTPGDAVLADVTYSDLPGWPAAADGNGAALVRRYPNEAGAGNDATDWRASGATGGSPGIEDLPSAGSYDAWVSASFDSPDATNPSVSSLSADPDGDGRTNFEEFAFATDPALADQAAVEFVWSNQGGLRYPAIAFVRPEGVIGVNYELLVSEDLSLWSLRSSAVTAIQELGGGRQRATIPDDNHDTTAHRFLQLRVTPDP